MRQQNPLLPGYAQATLAANIAELTRAGLPSKRAVAAAYRNARTWFRRRHPGKKLPLYLRVENPSPSVQDDRIEEAATLFEKFSGQKPEYVDVIDIPPAPDVLMRIGECDGILYTAVRDGETEQYIHEFKRNSRPTLAVTPDGTLLYLLGGAYDFTERGIVDRR